MNKTYSEIKIETKEVSTIAKKLYNLDGELIPLNGEIDFNFKISTNGENYLLKISRPEADLNYLIYQIELLNHLSNSGNQINSPKVINSISGKQITTIKDSNGKNRYVRLFSWLNGRLYSNVNPKSEHLLKNIGNYAGKITSCLKNFDHPSAHYYLDWDLANVEWTKEHLGLFNSKQQIIITYFLSKFENSKDKYNSLRKSVIHNDVNDNNIIVSEELIDPVVSSVIDYGDAVYTQTINDLAICIAYGIMDKPDVLSAATEIIKGYNASFQLEPEELEYIYVLVAMRLIITVSKAAINLQKEPENEYLQISAEPALESLRSWFEINENFALYSFRNACGLEANPEKNIFSNWTIKQNMSIAELFPSLNFNNVCPVDMSVSSTFIGHKDIYNNNELLSLRLRELQIKNSNSIIGGGYLETRPIYVTDAYKKEGNSGPEYRSTHLGVDFWIDPLTPVHSILDGEVISIHDNSNDKDYGPTVILKHKIDNQFSFYTLYGHFSKSSLAILEEGQSIEKGDQIGFIGNGNENGNWTPHLHFQIILDMLGNKIDFPGVAYPKAIDVWKNICPDPNLIFKEKSLRSAAQKSNEDLLVERQSYLGKSLSVSYNTPLHIVRGEGQYLIDKNGMKYLDTVNNVAHVGHEHPAVVKAAQDQIAILNTNTRYLHENINIFAKTLLKTFPKELSVVHFVNSGSEANELALRMANTFTNQKDFITVEIGYHGNTSGCVDVSSYKFDGKGGSGAPEFTHIVPLPDTYRGLYSGENSGLQYAKHIKDQIDKVILKGRNIAGFICESIISCGGQIELPEDYLHNAYKYVHDAGGLCIADEVQVGCGRVGSKFWGFELHDVIPDIVTIGKPLGNGHPVAAVVCTKEVAESFNNGMEYFNTFGGNPVSCAIGTKVLEVIKNEKLQLNALNIGNYLKRELKSLHSDFPIIGDVRGQGLFLGFELVDNNKNPETKKAEYLVNRMRELGILMSTDGKDNNVIKIKPPMVFSKENVDELIFRLSKVLGEDFMRPNYE